MNKRLTTLGLLVAALIALVSLSAACGDDGDSSGSGGDGLTLSEYMERLEQLSEEYNERTGEMEAEYDADLANIDTDEDGIRISNDFLRDRGNTITTFINGIERLSPPPEAQVAHGNAVTTGRAMAAAIAELADEADAAVAREDFNTIFDNSGVDAFGEAFEEACFAMQDLADANSIDVTFTCDE